MKVIQTADAPQAIGPYVQGKIANGFLFASGQIPLDPISGAVVGDDIRSQACRVFQNIEGLLKAAASNKNAVVKTTCFLKNMEDFAAFNEVYAEFFDDELPARSAVEVARLPKDVLIEVEIIAAVNN
ncbi:RidA family protein [Candidatus Enterococcus leclercqii]|uniref:RidA family protein n=1 Tax=Candidatus Enterococcus leclercqii TaxID=1857218 RepID=UPI00137B4B63|nr:RidA family protein [Enterococcus sp. CU9D]KAF1292173.1 regulator [Enterococcus sp. CU9D]